MAGRKNNTMEYTDEQLKLLIQLGILGSSVGQCANVLNVANKEAFFAEFSTPGTQTYEQYKKGADQGAFAIDSKLFNEAKSGEILAAVELRVRQSAKKTNDLKKKLFNV